MDKNYVVHTYGGYYIFIVDMTIRTNRSIEKATRLTKEEAIKIKEEIENKFDFKTEIVEVRE